MISPDLKTFKGLAKDANVIPIHRDIDVDFDTPCSLYLKMEGGAHSFLLESLEGGEKFGRYSFIGLRPHLIFRARGRTIWVETRHGLEERHDVNPVEELRRLFHGFRPAMTPGLPRFFGGAVGYLAYDIVKLLESRIPDTLPDKAGFNDIHLLFPRIILVHDNLKMTLKIIYNAYLEEGTDVDDAYEHGVQVMEGVERKIRKGLDYPVSRYDSPPGVILAPEMDKERFLEIVDLAKEYIRAGDCIQIVLSQRFSGKNPMDTFHIYRTLRRINPSPYLFYLKLGDETLIGSSPEILVRLTGRQVYVRPIAGTRPRGRTEEEDRALEAELREDPKERAEHLMLVDLGRNDIGRVCKMGSVRVEDFLSVERYSHVMHLVSGVTGELEQGRDMFDCLKACFPAGTVSGAPKIRAMEIIEELETSRRGPYAGAVGYFGFGGNMDLAITIRTLCQKGDTLYLQAGAGIVADSVPENEWQETLNKAKALMRAVEQSGKALD
ncbi:MAG TPA: anthranilate synthase component I [Anaerolineales bacterium]|nr:anthranilate synthase component I [Anaerolineales bacterium]